MQYLWPKLQWAFLSPPVAFIWGLLISSLTAFTVYWALPGVYWYGCLAAALQLAGVSISVRQLMQLRSQLGAKPISSIYREHLESFPQKRTHDGSGDLVGGKSGVAMTGGVYGSNSAHSTEAQLVQLWAAVRGLEGQLRDTESKLESYKKRTDESITVLSRRVDESMVSLFRRIQGALTSSPFLAFFGAWVFVCGSWMQLMLAVYHPTPSL